MFLQWGAPFWTLGHRPAQRRLRSHELPIEGAGTNNKLVQKCHKGTRALGGNQVGLICRARLVTPADSSGTREQANKKTISK